MGWKIGDKPTIDPQDTDYILTEQGGNTRNTTWAKIKTFLLGSVALSTTDKTIKGGINELASNLAKLCNTNVIINGDFRINQRAVSGTVTLAANAYGHDRWKAGSSGCTYTFSTVNGKTTITITAGSLIQVIEGINLQPGTYVMSWEGTAAGKIGTGSSSASGISSSVVGGVNLNVEFGTGTLANVKFEKGSLVTPFVPKSYVEELALCQRYYKSQVHPIGIANINYILSTGTTFNIPMRTTPTIATGAYTLSPYGNSNISGTVSSFSFLTDSQGNCLGIKFIVMSTTNLTVGSGYGISLSGIDAEIY